MFPFHASSGDHEACPCLQAHYPHPLTLPQATMRHVPASKLAAHMHDTYGQVFIDAAL